MAATYTTEGSVRGSCGHKHKTIAAARKCLADDHTGCKSSGGYSDRLIVRTDGEPLDDSELRAAGVYDSLQNSPAWP